MKSAREEKISAGIKKNNFRFADYYKKAAVFADGIKLLLFCAKISENYLFFYFILLFPQKQIFIMGMHNKKQITRKGKYGKRKEGEFMNGTSDFIEFLQTEQGVPLLLVCGAILLFLAAYLLRKKSKVSEKTEETSPPAEKEETPSDTSGVIINFASKKETVKPVSENGNDLYRYIPRKNIWKCPCCDGENEAEKTECVVCHEKRY